MHATLAVCLSLFLTGFLHQTPSLQPKLVLMDESTSALDTRNERLLYQALRDAGACSHTHAQSCIADLVYLWRARRRLLCQALRNTDVLLCRVL